jgi:hypothetical protein
LAEPSNAAALVLPRDLSSAERIHGTIAFDGEHSCAACGRRDRIATNPITRSLSTGVAAGAASRPLRETDCAIQCSVDEV